MRHEGVKSLARGQWRGILLSFGFPEAGLQARHGPCPFCGGKDRYRWDNKDGNGSYFCSQCGAGSGIDLLMKFKGWDYRTAAREVERLLGAQPMQPEVAKPASTAAENQSRVQELLERCRPIKPGDFVDRYFQARGIQFADYPDSLLACDSCWVRPGLWLPALVAADRRCRRQHGVAAAHVAWRRPQGGHRTAAQADDGVASARGMCPSFGRSRELCLAEGVETALSVEKLMDTPCWAALSASMMRKWEPPPGVEHVTICADNDNNRAGQEAAEPSPTGCGQWGSMCTSASRQFPGGTGMMSC